MKAIVQTKYGSPDVLHLKSVKKPTVGDRGVLVRIHAAAVQAGDWHLMRGEPFLIRFMFGGIRKPQIPILGADMAGIVEAVGKDVTQFKPGDRVFGDLSACGFGAFAEYVCVPETALALKPSSSFSEAATIPGSGLAALQGLRDLGRIQAGQQVLINGASGGVGSFAVQIAKALGAEVTAVCRTEKAKMVRACGADRIIDYTHEDATQTRQSYDLILDAAAYRPVFDYLPVLEPGGIYVMVGGSTGRFFQAMFLSPWISKFGRHQIKVLETKPNQQDLITLQKMVDSGKVSPQIGADFPLSDVPEAIHHLERRQVTGKVAISI